jgi:carboxylate-amine ligase
LNVVSRAIVVENKWRAQRYGVHGTFVNMGGDGATSVADMLDQLIEEITPDAESLGCLNEVKHCRTIVDAGTSADAQIAVFKEQTGSPDIALRAVTDWLAQATLQ